MVKAFKLLDWFGHGLGMWCSFGPYREQARSHRGFVADFGFVIVQASVGANLLAMAVV